MSINVLKALDLNLEPVISYMKAYATEQLDSLVCTDEGPNSISHKILNLYGVDIKEDYLDVRNWLRKVFKSNSIVPMRKEFEQFCIDKMKEVEGQPERMGRYLAFAWGVLTAWEDETRQNSEEKLFQHNMLQRKEYENHQNGKQVDELDAELMGFQAEVNESLQLARVAGLKKFSAKAYLQMSLREQNEFASTLTHYQLDELDEAICEFENDLHERTCNAINEALNVVDQFTDMSEEYGEYSLSKFELALQLAILRETIKQTM